MRQSQEVRQSVTACVRLAPFQGHVQVVGCEGPGQDHVQNLVLLASLQHLIGAAPNSVHFDYAVVLPYPQVVIVGTIPCCGEATRDADDGKDRLMLGEVHVNAQRCVASLAELDAVRPLRKQGMVVPLQDWAQYGCTLVAPELRTEQGSARLLMAVGNLLLLASSTCAAAFATHPCDAAVQWGPAAGDLALHAQDASHPPAPDNRSFGRGTRTEPLGS
mmetsp:Transcript_88397/g.189834  ORF Transcript_88397/g.189834 Transcript_88397/m.189834 type:complete len:218 (+) Transcript_88397:149-802(+)